MRIYIPTIGRTDHQPTFFSLPEFWQRRTTFICPGHELIKLRRTVGDNPKIWIQRAHVKGIAQVREYIVQTTNHKKILMLDDDLKFAHRQNGLKLVKSDPMDVGEAITRVDKLLDEDYAHGSISTREGNNHIEENTTFVGRSLRALAYRTDIIRKEKLSFCRVKLMEDFDMSLQLLRRGHKNFIIWDHCQDQGSSQADGGCSTYRTAELQKEAANALHDLHPKFVKVVEKETKSGWNGMKTRTDVRIAWKKAYESC